MAGMDSKCHGEVQGGMYQAQNLLEAKRSPLTGTEPANHSPSFPSQMHLNVDKQPHLVSTKVCQIYNVFCKLKHVLEKLLLNKAKKALRSFC